jgi:uncharacterized phage-associated protein
MACYDARSVSNYLVEIAAKDRNTLTPMQVLKLVYIAHGYSLGFRRTPLIKNRIEAWKYGPVIPELYHAVKHWRDHPVQIIDLKSNTDLEDDDKNFVDEVYSAYKDYDGIDLSALTHQPLTPWDTVYNPLAFGNPIPNNLIEHHYRAMISD